MNQINTGRTRAFLQKIYSGKKIEFHIQAVLIILFFCGLVTVLQGNPGFYQLPRSYVFAGAVFLILPLPAILLLLRKKERITEEQWVLALLYLSMLFRSIYVLLSGLYERQHDEGVYTGIGDMQVNPGHIGYIEYIYKFRKLPDFHPYQLFSYYHPPLHYLLSGLWLLFLTGLKMPEAMAFENLQVLPLFYCGLFVLVTYKLLKKIGLQGSVLYGGLFLICLHPALTFMSGSVNNDMLSNLILALTLYSVITWIGSKSLRSLLMIGLMIGLGLLCKINTAVIAFPIGLLFLMDFIRTCAMRNRRKILTSLFHYCAFLLVSAGTGLIWIVRNLILFRVMPGISSATPDSVMYTGNYSLFRRLGPPSLEAWHFTFPFHPLSGDAIHNIWVILFQTSLFAEEYPAGLPFWLLLLSQIIYVLSIVCAIFAFLLFILVQLKKWKIPSRKDEAIFLLSGYLIFLLSFIAFGVKYPYTCSSDFRYIVICLVYMAIGLAEGLFFFPRSTIGGKLCRILNALIITVMLLAALLFLFWGRW